MIFAIFSNPDRISILPKFLERIIKFQYPQNTASLPEVAMVPECRIDSGRILGFSDGPGSGSGVKNLLKNGP